jgi:predicted phosphodiesterase
VKLGLLADLHWSAAPEASASWHASYDFGGMAARCAATVDALVACGCELLVVAGDLTHDGDAVSCAAALDCIMRVSPVPVAVVEGNHDVRHDPSLVTRRADVREGWRRAAAVAAEQFVALHAVELDGDGRWTWGHGPQAAAGEPLATIVVSHFPLISSAARLAAAGLPCPGELADRDMLLAQLAATRTPTVVFSGHFHVRDATARGNVLEVGAAALVERPHEAVVVDVDPLAGVVRCTRIGSDGSVPEGGAEPWLLAPADERWALAAGSWTRREAGVVRHHVLAEA